MQKTQKGITLIALIITIIVMLILVGVSVNIALGNGLFKVAQSGAKNTELAKQKETELSSGQVTIGGKTYSSIESYTEGNAGLPAGAKVGDYISNYNPTPTYTGDNPYYELASTYTGAEMQCITEDDSLGWRIFSMDEKTGKIELISDNATSTKIKLKGATGWNCIEKTLNDVCKILYSSNGVGVARSVSFHDISGKDTGRDVIEVWVGNQMYVPGDFSWNCDYIYNATSNCSAYVGSGEKVQWDGGQTFDVKSDTWNELFETYEEILMPTRYCIANSWYDGDTYMQELSFCVCYWNGRNRGTTNIMDTCARSAGKPVLP